MADYKLVPVDTLKSIYSDLDACQRVIWMAGGLNQAYYEDAQARLQEIYSLLEAPDYIIDAGEKVSRTKIREVFLRNGAVIPADRDDLPDYVYESVFELLEMAAPAVQGEPVAYAVFADNGNIRIWCADPIQAETLRLEYGDQVRPLYTAPQPVEQQPRSDALIVKQTESIAVLLAKTFYGSQMENGEAYRDSKNLKAQQCWNVACRIQEELTCTDVENSVAELDEESPAEQQPAPDVPGLTEALRQYQHNDGSGLVFGYDRLLVDQYVTQLVDALEFYANGEHLMFSDESAWDTVSGEPQNLLCGDAGTATVEDGYFAKAALAAYRKGGDV